MTEWEVNGETYRKDDVVSLEVQWANGSVRRHDGRLEVIANGRAYIEIQGVGYVDGDAETIELIEHAGLKEN